MLLYGIIILGTMAISALVHIFTMPDVSWYVFVIAAFYFAISVIIIDGLFAGFARWFIPKKWVDKDKKIYQISKKEIKFYDFLQIKKWKNLVPELGGFTDFHKNKIDAPKDNTYLEKYMLEACYGMWGHMIGAPMGFLIILLDFKMYTGESTLWLTMALPFACVNFILDLIPAFILRYNLSRLQVMYKFNLKQQMRKERKQNA